MAVPQGLEPQLAESKSAVLTITPWDKQMVGAEGFEPPTACSQSKCTTRLCYAPIKLFFQTVKVIGVVSNRPFVSVLATPFGRIDFVIDLLWICR